MKTNIYYWSYLSHFFSEWESFRTKVVQKIKTHILYAIKLFFRKSCLLWNNVEKYCRAWQVTGENSAHGHCMINTLGYKHTLKVCNTYCSSTARMIVLTRLKVMLYLHCLSCFIFASVWWIYIFDYKVLPSVLCAVNFSAWSCKYPHCSDRLHRHSETKRSALQHFSCSS
jgi:hypothetical protein